MTSSIQKKYPHLTRVHSDGNRPELLEAADISIKRYIQNEDITGHLIPPRVGKSSIIRMISLEATELKAPFTLTLGPWTNLSEQICDINKSTDFMSYYKINSKPFVSQSISKIKHHKWYERRNNHVDLFACTIQLALSNITALIESIEYANDITGSRPIIIVDEVHLVSEHESAEWGKLIEECINAGAYIVSLTGTHERVDKQTIPGFINKFIEKKDCDKQAVSFYKKVNVNGKDLNRFSKKHGEESEYKLVPIGGVNVPWGTAWSKNWMAHLNVITLDFKIKGTDNLLSELSATNIKSNLASFLKDEQYCIPLAVKTSLNRLLNWRRHANKNTQMLVVTGRDTQTDHDKKRSNEDDADYHARAIKREIEKQLNMLPENDRATLGRLKTSIATSGKKDNKAAQTISDFVNGNVDILIVKNMGLVGMDVPSCKINLMLSPLRNGPTFKQAITRQLTIWDKVDKPGDLIIPLDILARDQIDQLRKTDPTFNITSWNQQEFFDTEIKEDEKEKEQVELDEGYVSGYVDETGKTHNGNDEKLLSYMRYKYGMEKMTDVDLLELHDKGGLPINDEDKSRYDKKYSLSPNSTVLPKVINLTEKTDLLKGVFGKKAKEMLRDVIHYDPLNPGIYVSEVRRFHGLAKRLSGVTCKLETIEDPDILENLINNLNIAFNQLYGHKYD